MGLFGKKQDPEEREIEDEEFELENDFETRKLKKQLRDLKSENRKSRQEPVKPWGKKERLIILVVMLVTILISGSLYLTSRPNLQFSIHNLQLPKLELPDLDIFKEGTIIITKHD
ncbi:MAG TPA: hypothetical protein VL401_00570 [Alphaproteobacteria bacterium]|jgi:hypothetical protein|nr:hypothetical protein [Alphaproteobacteria bacterium]